jgi:fluoroquinolone resistance protein
MSEIISGTEYDNQDFTNLNLQQSLISRAEFQSCSFNKCNLSRSTLSECRFYDCTFLACDFSLIKPSGSQFRNSSFSGSKLVGINWLEGSKQFSTDFEDCLMNLSSFFGMNLKKRKLKNCIAHEVDFSESNMTDCNCTGSDFAQSIFAKTNLTKADFSNATNYLIDFRNNNLTKAKFSLPEALSLLKILDIVITD